MSDTNYTLEWRGTKKSGFSYADIEAALATGDLHSLYKINVDGRWVVLRDFVEQQRAAAKRSAAPVLQESTYSQPVAPSPYSPPPPVSMPVPSYAAPAQQVALPPLPLHEGMPYGYQMPQSFQEKAQKPVWFWPVIITSATVCILMAIVTVYVIATRQSTPSYGSSNSNGSSVANNTSGNNANSPANGNSSSVGNGNPSATANGSTSGTNPSTVNNTATANGNSSGMNNSGATVADAKPEPKPEAKPEPKPEPKPEAKSAHMKILPYSITGKEIYPSAVVSTATVDWNGAAQSAEDKKTDEDAQLGKHDVPLYGDENSWLGIELAGVKKGSKVSVEITAEGYMKPSKEQLTVNAVSEKGHVLVMPKIMWDYEALFKVRQQRPLNVVFSASIDGVELPHVTDTYTLRSINDCPIYLVDKSSDQTNSLAFLFAAYVNENHPQVQEVLKEARACGFVDQFDGYQSNKPEEVMHQVFAVWNALQRRGIKYSDVSSTPPGDQVICQSVRFLHESINNQQANCVDGSVLMASVLKKIGIQSFLVIVPKHCFLAFNIVRNSAALPIGLETTMLGNNDITDVKKLDLLPPQERNKENDASVNTFTQAVNEGNFKIESCARQLLSERDVRYRLISIDDERKRGINPIPYSVDK